MSTSEGEQHYPEPTAPYIAASAASTLPPLAPAPPIAPDATGDSGGGLAITGLIFGIIAMLGPVFALSFAFLGAPRLAGLLLVIAIPVAVIGVVLSAVGRSSVRQRGSANAGLMLSTIALVLALGVLLFAVALFHGVGPGRVPGPLRRRMLP